MLEGCSSEHGGAVSEPSGVSELNAQVLVQNGANAPAATIINANESNQSYSSTNGGLATGDEEERYLDIQQQTTANGTDPGFGTGRTAESPPDHEPQLLQQRQQ